jgi:hypothetical protein
LQGGDLTLMGAVINTTAFYIITRPEIGSAAKSFLRAFGHATHAMFQQRDAAKTILAKYTKVEDPGMLEGSLRYAQDFTEKIPLVKRAGVQVVLDQEAAKSPKAKEIAAEQFFDNSLVQELINEGFYRSLWGK